MNTRFVAVTCVLLLTACAHVPAQGPLWASQAHSSSPLVQVSISPQVPRHVLNSSQQESICIKLDSQFNYQTALEQRLQADLSALLSEKGLHPDFSCPNPVLYVHVQDAGITSKAKADGFLTSGYGSSVTVTRDFSIVNGPPRIVGFDGLVGMAIVGVSKIFVTYDTVHTIILDIRMPQKGIQARMVATVPYETEQWRDLLYGEGVEWRLVEFF